MGLRGFLWQQHPHGLKKRKVGDKELRVGVAYE